MAEAALDTSTGILRFLYDFSYMAITRNIEGLTHADSLIVPLVGGNCANWALGHVLHNRTYVLGMLHEQPLWAEADGEPYETGSKPLDPKDARPWDSLVQDLNATQERIRRGLDRLDPEELDLKHVEEAKRPRGAQLHFMHFHESYHAGQIGLLRRMTGKAGAI